ncbi:predicted protein [Streptomyces viridochromogenes DSM 40736]|uniref:Predicted protein n=1 Tax=Streptomyces viridochromogenes (strain DSM 40736 / JCM 4977 / BCRC 1201 / Tue 494) TaxID=591159 RepID=D9X0B8_STRVT|nr:hypothetical protein [Streptomyces viridochromogenes]EFL35502.1 predicted protein [Streptomyces viridochromogenes DSM 40736]
MSSDPWRTTTKTDPRRKQIKKRLREIKRDPASARPGEAQRLAAEYRRLLSADRTPAAPADPDEAALATWPRELRARRQRSAFSRVLDRSALHDPGSWGALNDLRHR